MNEAWKKKIVSQNALTWGAAIIAPAVAMVVIDATTRETPNQNYIAMLSSGIVMVLFAFSNVWLGRALGSVGSEDASDGTQSFK